MWDQILKMRALYENRRCRGGSFIEHRRLQFPLRVAAMLAWH
jgi:hypothetical protein